MMNVAEDRFLNCENFFITETITREYSLAKEAFHQASLPPKKKVYKSMNKMLQEGFLVGSLKYGNNFIA